MKITDIEVIKLRQKENIEVIGDSTQDAVIVRVHTDEGITGVGEVASSPYVIEAIVNAPASKFLCFGLKEICMGQDPLEIEKIWYDMYHGSSWFGLRGAGIQAISGIDMALWDIKGKALGQPVYKLIGGAFQRKIRAYASVLFPDTPEEMEALVKKYCNLGFTAIKFGWGKYGLSHQDDIDLIRAARGAAGPHIDLMVDAGGCYQDAATVIKEIKQLEDSDIYWLEEPLPPDDLAGLAKIAQATRVRIATGERLSTRYEFRSLIELGKVDIVQPDVGRVGGISEFMKVALIAHINGIPCIPHAWSSDILLAATMHVNAAIPNGGVFQEFCLSERPLRKDLIKEPLRIVDGCISVPEMPGLGIELNENTIEKFRIN